MEAPRHDGEPRPKRLLDYAREMQRIAQLDIDIAYTGHGEPITAVRDLVETRLALHHKRADKLYSLFEGQPCSWYELTQKLFPKVHDTEKFLSLSEVLGHLDLLERDGRVTQERRDGLVYWCPTAG
jgi:hypothetical protein